MSLTEYRKKSTSRWPVDLLKLWQSSDIWELHEQIKIAFMKKLTAGPKQRFPVTLLSRMFCLCVPPEIQTYED